MTWGVCLEFTPVEPFRRTWGYLIQECEVPNAWERNTHERSHYNWDGWHFNVDMKDVPDPLVVLTPIDGSKLKGTISLWDYVHPENAVYYFGSDKADLRHENIGREKYDKVYIPDCGFMHSFTAAAMVIYDRKIKEGR